MVGPPPPRKLKTLGQPRVAGWGRHKEGLCAGRLGCPQDSGGRRRQEPVSVPFCFLRRPPECPELWPSLARPAHPQPLPLSSWALGYSCRLLCDSVPKCFAQSLRTTHLPPRTDEKPREFP